VGQVASLKRGWGCPHAGFIEGMARSAQAAGWSKTRGGRAHGRGVRGRQPRVRGSARIPESDRRDLAVEHGACDSPVGLPLTRCRDLDNREPGEDGSSLHSVVAR
jgi:hypothetical protein